MGSSTTEYRKALCVVQVCVSVCLSVCGRVRVLPSSEASSWPCRVETSRDASISHLLPTRHTQQLLQAWVLIWVHLHVYKSGIMPHNKKNPQNKTEERNCIKEKWKLQLKWLSQSVCFGYESCVTGYQVLELPMLSLTAVELTGDYRWQVRPVFTWQMYNPTNWLHANYKLISNRLNHRDQLFDASVISCTIMYWALLSIDCTSVWQVLINGVISIQDSQVSAAQVLCNKVAVYLLHQQAGASTSTCTGASTSTCCSVLSTECQ